ncbi:MAG: stage II sporulation protein R [Clostridia bacterium]
MKQFNKILFMGFFLTVLFSCLDFVAESDVLSDKLIRMHVKANSDSDYDQEIKIEVKEEVAIFAEQIMLDFTNLEDAEIAICKNLLEIEDMANEKLLELGTDYTAKVSFEEEFFPTREYDTFTLPAGYYKALKVDIGEAQGQNWWCVVYPTLCTASSVEDCSETLSDTEIEIITESPEISFWFYECYLQIIEFFGEK